MAIIAGDISAVNPKISKRASTQVGATAPRVDGGSAKSVIVRPLLVSVADSRVRDDGFAVAGPVQHAEGEERPLGRTSESQRSVAWGTGPGIAAGIVRWVVAEVARW